MSLPSPSSTNNVPTESSLPTTTTTTPTPMSDPITAPSPIPSMESIDMITNYVSFLSNVCGALKLLKRTGWIRHQVPLPESDSDHMHRCAMCAMLVMSSSSLQQQPSPSSQQQVNGIKLLKMALTHDLCEALAGDITPHCDAALLQSKHGKERAAMEHIRELIDGVPKGNEDGVGNNSNTHHTPLGEELYQLWNEYEEQTTLEAIYCKDIDKFEMVLQAYEYEKLHLRHRNDGVDAPDNAADHDNNNNDNSTLHVTQNVQDYPLRGFFISTNAAMKTTFFRQLDAQVRKQREDLLRERGWTVTELERQQP